MATLRNREHRRQGTVESPIVPGPRDRTYSVVLRAGRTVEIRCRNCMALT
jgi:hypothetical protein